MARAGQGPSASTSEAVFSGLQAQAGVPKDKEFSLGKWRRGEGCSQYQVFVGKTLMKQWSLPLGAAKILGQVKW